MVDSILKKEIFELIKQDLLKNSLKNKKQTVFYKELNEKILGTVSFGISNYGRSDIISLNPVIGVMSKDVENLMEKTTGLNTLKDFMPTISTPLGYLLLEKSYKEWEFEKGKDNAQIVAEMVGKITTNGFSFFKGRDTLKGVILEVEKDNFILQPSKLYKLPLLYYCNGEKEKGLDFINRNMTPDNTPYQTFKNKYKEL